MALNPLGLAPLTVVVAILAFVFLASASDAVDTRLTRIARRLFGRYVRESSERERRLEAAYIGQSYRTYAARTYLFTGLGAIGGAVAGAYAVGGFLLLVPTIIDLMLGLPRTMVNVLGIRGFELVLTNTQTLAILVVSGIIFGGITAGLTYVMRWETPRNKAAVRERNIDAGMARTIAFMYALSRGGMSFPDVMRVLAANDDIYGENAREFGVAVREMDLFGRDMITSLKRMNRRTPSEQFKTFSENLSSVLQSGQSLSSFLHNQYERHQEEAAERQEDLLESLATIAEAYVTIFVAGVLFLITILMVFGLTTTDTLPFLQLLGYLAVPLANLGFMVYLSQKLSALGIGDTGTTTALEDEPTATLGRPSALVGPTEIADGGTVREGNANWARLRFHDQMRSVKSMLRSPVRTLVWNPTNVLYLAIPVAVLLFVARVPAAFQTASVNLRLLDDLLVQSLLLVLGSFAIVRFVYTRRVSKIESATPELLERLASLNEAGMTLVTSIKRVRGSDVGVLSPEVARIWTDIRMGANVDDALVRFGRRIRTTSISRVVTLVTNAMHASGQLGPVLRIAATQSREDHRLRKRRRQEMLTYLVVIYISFLVFLVIIIAVQEVLVPALPSSVPVPESNGLGVNTEQFARLGRVDKAAYTLVFFHIALVQAVLTGFIGGQLGEGSLKDGAKHAAVMLGVAYLVFVVLSSPVASMTVQNPSVDNGQLTVDSASVSAGGFIVVHADDANGTVLGTSQYLAPGSHQNVRITLGEQAASQRSLVLVAHQDTNENRRLDYNFDSPGETDQPYAASGQSEFVSVEVELQNEN